MSQEVGFYHAERGYWQTTNEPDASILAMYPTGTIQVPLKPGVDWVPSYEGTNFTWVQQLTDEALASEQAIKEAEIRNACQTFILGNFESSALGTPHFYPNNDEAQRNLLGSVQASMLETSGTYLFWCADAEGNWTFAEHTTSQIQTVGLDARSHVLNAQIKCAQLLAQLGQATTLEEVHAITW